MSYRIDVGEVLSHRVDHNGNLIVEGALTRAGVFTYKYIDATGKVATRRELRHPNDVFHPDAIASFIQNPLTNDHPPTGKVGPDNFKKYAVGNIGDTLKRDGRFLKAVCTFRDKDAIAALRGDNGAPPKRELSCGYTAKVVKESGVYMGERYDHRQTEIRGNHVALVRAGRAGPEVKVLMDSLRADAADGDVDFEDFAVQDFALDAEEVGELLKHDVHVVGKTNSGRDVPASTDGNDYTDWTVEDHEDAKWNLRNHHRKLRDTLAVAQQVGLSDEAQNQIKGLMGTVKGAYEFHKSKALTLDAEGAASRPKVQRIPDEDVLDDHGAPPRQDKENTVKRKITKVSVGRGDSAFKLDGFDLEYDEKHEAGVQMLVDQRDALAEQLATMRSKLDESDGEIKGLRKQLEDADDPAKLEAAATRRNDALELAQHVGLKREDMANMTTADILKATVAKEYPDEKLDDASPEYIQGLSKGIRKDAKKAADAKQHHRELATADRATNQPREDADNEHLSPRERFIRDTQGLHTKTDKELGLLPN